MPAVASFDPSQPFTAIDEAIAGSIPANPSAIDLAVAPPIPAATPAVPEAPAFDPTQPFEPVPEAPAPVVGGPVFDASKEFQKSFLPEDLNTKTVEELDADKDFNPVAFGFEHEAALNSDPILKQKVLDAYKLREATGRTTSDQLKEAAASPGQTALKPFKATFEMGKTLLGGAAQVVKNVSDAGVGGAFRLLGAASVGGKAAQAGLNEEGKRIERAQAEIIAAPEAAATGTVDLLRRGVRTAVETAAKLDPTGFVQDVTGEKAFSELTNDEVAARFSNDVAGKKAIAEAGRGAGEMMKAIGLHADELKEAGIELRPGVIEAMSPALDITNLLPLGAGAKVGMMTKTGGRYAVRELATAATPLQASGFIEAINKGAQKIGTGVEKAGDFVNQYALKHKGTGTLAAAVASVAGTGGLVGGAKVLAVTKLTGPALFGAGRLIKAAAPAAIDTAVEFTKGYGQGLLFTAPFMIGADAEEREGLLGAAGLGGVARGGIRGFKHVGEAAQDRLAATIFKAVDQSEPPKGSFDHYGTDPRLDAESAAQIAKLDMDPVRARAARVAQLEKAFDAETVRLDAQSGLTPKQYEKRLKERAERIAKVPEVVKAQQNLLGWARHVFKDSGVEFYATDDAGMMRQTGGQSGRGYTVKTGQTIAPDGAVKPLVRVFLNGDVESLPHEMLHALGELDAPKYAEFRNEVNATLTPDQRKSFETIYNTVHNGMLPEAQWKRRLTPEQVTNEIAAELFSRTVLGEDLTGVPQPLRETTAIVASALLEMLGIPLGKLSAAQAKDFVPKGTKIKAGFSTLGLRPGTAAQAHGQNFIQGLLKQAKAGGLTAPAEASAVAGGPLVPGEISRRPSGGTPPSGPSGPGAAPISPRGTPPAPAPASPGATTPAVPPATTPTGPRNIRVTRERQDAFGIPKAKADAAALGNPDVVARVNEISEVMGTDTPALEIEYRSVKDDGSPGDPTPRNPRRKKQEEERAAIAMGEIPENVRELVQKVIVPVRWVTVGEGKPELIAMSLDKVAANVQMVVKDATGKRGAEVPYERAGETLSERGWGEVIEDLKTYARNQANGYKGDGGKLIRPEASAGMDIPNETPGFNPTVIADKNRADFLNMVQGFKLPFTNIRRSAGVPANLKGQKLAEINFRKVEPPVKAAIRPQDILKQTFPASVTEPIFPGRGPMDIAEPNPLRNQFWDAGVDVGKLTEGVERISPEQVATVTPRPDIDYQAPVTDIIRGGFLPGGDSLVKLERDPKSTEKIQEPKKYWMSPEGRLFEAPDGLAAFAEEHILDSFHEDALEAAISDTDWSPLELNPSGDYPYISTPTVPETLTAPQQATLRAFSDSQNLGRRGESPGQLLPGATMFLKRQTVENIGRDILNADAERWQKITNEVGGLTNGAYRLGASLTDVADVARLRYFEEGAKQAYDNAKTVGDFDAMMVSATKKQFFTEALETATGSSPGKKDLIGRLIGADWKPPFPEEAAPKGQLLPGEQTDAALRHGFLPDPKPAKPEPDAGLRTLAGKIALAAGVDYKPAEVYAPLDPKLSNKLADFYDTAKSAPDSPEVVASYKALTDETLKQYRAIAAAGYVIEPFTGEGEPYKSSAEAVADIRDNKHLFVLTTKGENFSGDVNNPMLAPSGVEGLPTENDVFRGVHDFFGHAKEGYQFGPRGEFNAWRAHSEMYSPEAQGALAAETLAQNSWVNFGPHLRGKAEIPPSERPFAEQKAVVVPQELIDEARGIAGQLLPKTEAGRKLAEEGYDFVSKGGPGYRGVQVLKDGVPIGDISSTAESEGRNTAKIAGVHISRSFRGLGVGEALYRELLTDLKADDIKKVTGRVIGPGPLAIRKKLLGDFTKLTVRDKPISIDEAVAVLEKENTNPRGGSTAVVAENAITPESQFLPKTEAGRKLEEAGFIFRESSAGLGVRLIEALKNKEVVGSVGWTYGPDGPEMEGVFVNPNYQRQGIGETLYRELGAQLQALGETELRGGVENPAALRLRRKVYPGTVAERGTPSMERPVLATSPITPESQFLPAKESEFPLTPYEQFLKDKEPKGVAKKSPVPRVFPKTQKPEDTRTTGWILPNQKFIGLDAAFHEQYLAENSDELNEKFGTKFSNTADVDARLAALNKGFVRIRGGTQGGGALNMEMNARYFKNPTRRAVEAFLANRAEDIDRFSISLLNDKGRVVDSANARVFELEGAERANALLATLDDLRLRGPEGQLLPKSDDLSPSELKYKDAGEYFAIGHDAENLPIDQPINKNSKVWAWLDNSVKTAGVEHSHGMVWGHDKTDKTFKGRYDAGTDTLSFVAPEITKVTSPEEISNSVLSKLQSKFGKRFTMKFFGPEGGVQTRGPGGAYLPGGEETLPGLNLPSEERAKQMRVKSRVAKSRDKFPEALKLAYAKDDAGQFVLGEDGKPKPQVVEYGFMNTPLAREAAKGLKGEARQRAFVAALGDKLEREGKAALKRPDLEDGRRWYSTARTRLKGLFGDDSKFFAELLAATSARTAVDINYRFALEAYNQFKLGKFDLILEKYREGKADWEAGRVKDFLKENPANDNPSRGQFLDWYVEKHNLVPTQSNGKRFGANSRPVLRVLDGSWRAEVQGPKTPNFMGNLTGESFKSTIDVWSARTLHRLANEGSDKPWRILPEMETGVTEADFEIGQQAYDYAAKNLAMRADSLQAVLWFAEKDKYEKNGWTRGAGSKKSDFNVLLKETEKAPGGTFKMKTPQMALDFELKPGDIVTRKKR